MNPRRWLAAGLFTAVILLTLGAIVYIYAANNSQTTTVFALKHEVFVGQAADPNDVSTVTVKYSSDEFSFAYQGDQAALAGSTYLNHRQAGDILGKDDVTTSAQPALVSVSVANAPALAAGDLVDLYVNSATGGLQLIGRHIPVYSVGNPLTLAVRADLAPYWVAVGTAKLSLTAVKSYGQSPCPGQQVGISVTDAVNFLVQNFGPGDPNGSRPSKVQTGPACSGAGTGATTSPGAGATPAASPAPTP